VASNRFENRSRIVIAVETDRGALEALMDNPVILQEDDPATPFTNAVRRGIGHLRAAAALSKNQRED
jgi:hypothetical protein